MSRHSPTPEPDPSDPRPTPPPRRLSKDERLARLRLLTLRDHDLLDWLAEHYLLSADQIAAALFPSKRSALLRLAALHRYEAVHRFGDLRTGTDQYLYTLGPLGVDVHPRAYSDPLRPDAPAPRTSVERAHRIIGSGRMNHLLGTNQLFIDLHAYTRADPDATLLRWWSEQHASAAYAIAGVRPDGHGIWRAAGRTVGFFLEHDNNTEPLRTVLGKLRAYERLAQFGPRYPVLLRVPNRRREANLLDALAGVPTVMPVATGLHHEHPAGPAWTLASDPGSRRWLHELPSDHGPDTATNPHHFTDPDDG
ncbi:replication-relaxation family protein [Micromonospora sp. WMMD980]|uniref:replication-relaxation family protein n=1 Tax=Micromonospora sp. WMMD980 TaxID=3016088 RepID=UPI002415BE2C|nr:replication-relaxation family protein [Micromonospora sp. WMMD980]MDG4803660.1 replication-relaxation family protein [Micromonospora sp. WMMD980]